MTEEEEELLLLQRQDVACAIRGVRGCAWLAVVVVIMGLIMMVL